MNKRILSYKGFIFLLLTATLFGCGNRKYLNDGEFLYNGSSLSYSEESKDFVDEQKGLSLELQEVFYPTPNAKLFGIARTKLWFYNVTKEPKTEKGFRNFLKYKIGSPPVLMKQTDPDRISRLLTNRLYNKGFFKASVDYEVKLGKKEGEVKYKVSVSESYKIDSIFFPPDTSDLLKRIKKSQKKSLLKRGAFYNLETLKKERQRVSDYLRNRGYYYFEPDFILFEVDSTIGAKDVNVYLSLKENINPKLMEIYYLNNIYIYPNYNLRYQVDSFPYDTVAVKEYLYLQKDSAFRPEIIADNIYIKKYEPFSREHHEYTVNRLLGLNSFQFVNLKYTRNSEEENLLNVAVQLTPFVKKSIRMELSAKSKSNGFTGPGFETTFKNRNAMRGGELFKVNFLTGYETQIGSTAMGLNSYELGISTELDIPRFLLPFNFSTQLSRYTPHSVIRLGYKTLSRVNFFRVNSFESSFGYKWQESETKFHELLPINLNYTKLAKTEPAFDSIINTNPIIKRSFEEQFIIGSIYSFIYDEQLNNRRKNNYYFKGTIDISGNLAQLVATAREGKKFGDTTSYEFLGSRFSQYLRLETINKYYLKTGKNNQWVNRVIVGLGLPHGNSQTLPYIKQFFIGGGNSIRAFQARTLGPGAYRRDEEATDAENNATNANLFLDQSGDIKIEFNTEYRFDIYTIFKGAVFVDAGNIWLLNEDTLRPGGEFQMSKFYDQFAVGTGFGLRIDPDFFVIRLDLGFPLRKPFLPQNERWVYDEFGKDAVLNIAIGYPF